MGTKKGQKRKTARRAYEPKKKGWIKWTDTLQSKKQARLLAQMWRKGGYYPSGVRVRTTATKKKRSGQGRKAVGWSLFVTREDIKKRQNTPKVKLK